MNTSVSVPATVKSVSFSFLSSEDIRRISVKQIVNRTLLDALNRPTTGGLYDPALGPSSKQDLCSTCHLNYFTCPGHFGHIELPVPVFHPLFMMNTYNLLRTVCLYCHRFKTEKKQLVLFAAKLKLLEHGLLSVVHDINDPSESFQEDDGNELDRDEAGVESFEGYKQRMQKLVQSQLKSAPGSNRDNYKDGHVYQTRKDVILEFLKLSILSKKCYSCQAYAHTFRKEGHTKVVEYDLTAKQKALHDVAGLHRPDVLARVSKGREGHDTVSYGMDIDELELGPGVEGGETGDLDKLVVETEAGERLPKAVTGKVKTKRGRNERIVTPEEVREHLRNLFRNEPEMCGLLFGRHGKLTSTYKSERTAPHADMFFMEVIPVSPTRFRPPAKMGETLFENPANELLSKVLNTTYKLRDTIQLLREVLNEVPNDSRLRLMSRFFDELLQLQVDVNSFLDSSKNPTPVRQGKLPPQGKKQVLEKKEGLFRMNMMGKRVNYAARSVISPDVNIEPSEIGVPPVFARKLTFPEPVTPHNVHHLSSLVRNGTEIYPGASMVEYEDGSQQFLDKLTLEQRIALASQLLTPQEGSKAGSSSMHPLMPRMSGLGKKVYRHLVDGDVLILNRQPTLHKPSMMVHRARVLKGEKTIRMHYANCNSYNADFDGDEMNIHFPQNHVARAEAELIANTDNQYLVPTSGKPLRGLIQDHVVAGVWMTNKLTFFAREEYLQLIYGALRPEDETIEGVSPKLKLLPPTIWKPRPLWTGKQVISTVLLNITPSNAKGLNLTSKSKIPNRLWGKMSTEETVLFMDGLLLCGVLDKSQFGASEFGLVHSVYELYGATAAGRLLGILSRLFTKYLQSRAFTCRIDDLALTLEGDAKRAEIMKNASMLGTEAAKENFAVLESIPKDEQDEKLRSLLEEILRDNERMAALDSIVQNKMRGLHKSIADAVMPSGLIRKFPDNHMQTMTLSGAKGSAVNVQQISCALGQQALEGRRVPIMVSGKTLPSFRAFETAAIAGGYIGSRFLTGIKPQEFFFHCMAGREGLIDTAVKTSRSGYLQRCLIKHLEGLRVYYDHTVRDADGSIYQFLYGGDGLDVTRQKHLYQFDFSVRNSLSLLNRYQPRHLAGKVDDSEAIKYMKRTLKSLSKGMEPAPLPALSLYHPNRHLGSTSERFAMAAEKYLKENPSGLIKSKHSSEGQLQSRYEKLSSHVYRMLMNVKYIRSLADPGEAVGLLASQGVGEPSTQMTLNTFHFAGHGAANVTLGIPRLREIIMTASTKPKTPNMTIFSSPGKDRKTLESFCKLSSRLTLSQLVDFIEVRESIAPPSQTAANLRRKHYQVIINLYPMEEYSTEYQIKRNSVHNICGSRLSHVLQKELAVELKRLEIDLKTQQSEIGRGRAPRECQDLNDADEDEEDAPPKDDGSEVGDGDVEDAKHARQAEEQISYSDNESDEISEDDDVNPVDPTNLIDDEVEESDEEAKPVAKETSEETLNSPRDIFLGVLPAAVDFKYKDSQCKFILEFGMNFPKLLLVDVLERACRKTIIREISGISDCFILKDQPKAKHGEIPIDYTVLMTNGSNLRGIWSKALQEDPIIQFDNIYTNDIFAILTHYGVEAARSALIKEVSSVFGSYNIDVDFRHLELIADYMTFNGGYKAFNRGGIASNSSPFLKASYETTTSFICDAALFGDYDTLASPSGSIIVGRPAQTGTGSFDIVVPLSYHE